LLKRGVKVCLVDVQNNIGIKTQEEFANQFGKEQVMFRQCDVTSIKSLEDSFDAAVQRFGHLDLMVNNAGIADESNLVQMININLIAAIQGSQLAMEHMRKDKGGQGGRIVNVASTAGLIGVYFSPRYCASKFGLVGYHKSMASNPHNQEMGLQYGCLCPAFTDTAIIQMDSKKINYLEEGVQIMSAVGIQKVEIVVDGFMHFVDSEGCNGDVVTVTSQKGIQIQNPKSRKRHPKSQL